MNDAGVGAKSTFLRALGGHAPACGVKGGWRTKDRRLLVFNALREHFCRATRRQAPANQNPHRRGHTSQVAKPLVAKATMTKQDRACALACGVKEYNAYLLLYREILKECRWESLSEKAF